jgi:putative hydrolase of HD superfamily
LEKMTHSSLQKIVKFLEILGILKRVKRTGWTDIGIYEPESVADHTFRTAFLCMLYADITSLDPLKLLRMALIHDLPEAIIGDLTPSQKTSETRAKEESAMHQILGLLPDVQREKYLAVWREYQEGKTKEVKAVLQLDKIEMVLQAKEYEKFGSANKQSLKGFSRSAEEATTWSGFRKLLSVILEKKLEEKQNEF